ncbi:MAG: S46 family peptidase [Acidobacteria bacterium]|nr:S46 family peptidase [Acidobacteriota bacterium]
MRRTRAALAALLLLAATLGPAPALADEGMWTFNNLPRAEIKKRYGFEVTDEWVRRVQSATVRFPNGTGSFVSPEGLVLTNYHIVEDIVGELSTAERDLAKSGFVARARAEELKIPGLVLDQLVRIEDVTARVTGAVKAGATDADAGAARQAEIGRIESEASKSSGLRADVVTLYRRSGSTPSRTSSSCATRESRSSSARWRADATRSRSTWPGARSRGGAARTS